MNIAVIAPFNPAEFKGFLSDGQVVPNINKAASSVNAIALGLLKAGHKLTVISSYEEEGPTINLAGKELNIHLVSSFSKMPKSSTFRRWYMVRRLRKLLAQYVSEVDVIHAHWTYDYALAACAFVSNKPVFCTIRDWAPIIRRHLVGIKPKTMWWLVSESLFRKVMRNPDVHFIANSPYIHQLVKSTYPRVICDIIENPIKKEFIRESRPFYPTNPVIVSITQDLAEPRKNFIGLLHAFQILLKTYPNAKLQLVGHYTSQLRKTWDEEGLTHHVEFLGFINHDSLTYILDNASVLVHPSFEESFGNTLLEGMARRLPVVGGKDSGAVPYVLGQGEYGLLCDVKSPSDLSKVIIEALNINSMETVIDNATHYLKTELTHEVIAKKHIQLFSQSIPKRTL